MSSSRNQDAARLSTELLAAALRELVGTWHSINYNCFRQALRLPTILITEAEGVLGRWSQTFRTIEISRRLLLQARWTHVVEVLKHEMAHQYVHEVLGIIDETAHGSSFRDVCERCGIDPAASGLPMSDAIDVPEEQDRVLQRIARLLALAESPNEHEAEAAMQAAQRLMLKYNLDHVSDATRPRYSFRHLGNPTGRITEKERLLADILGTYFFVESIWIPVYRPLEGKRGSVLEICGTPANLEMASYAYRFLTDTAERLWLEHKKQMGSHSNRDRLAYIAGVMTGFRDKLRTQDVDNRKEGLVWVRDANLQEYFQRRFPHVRRVTYRRGFPSDAYHHGREAGQQIVLHRPIESATSVGPRLLPARS